MVIFYLPMSSSVSQYMLIFLRYSHKMHVSVNVYSRSIFGPIQNGIQVIVY